MPKSKTLLNKNLLNLPFLLFFSGESILLCRETERKKVEELVRAPLRPVASCLIQGNGETLCSSMKRAILEVKKFLT
jgi:hypothetical protein